ncbi:MAG: acyltransferase [Sideroxyarcus sp.]|nr:acyltransferase [Sideroxyarcus sp.]
MKLKEDCSQMGASRLVSSGRDGTYLPTLDGWRTIAIALVIIAHSSDSIQNALMPDVGNAIFDFLKLFGLVGVQIFFGLSGFLITTRLVADEAQRGSISLKSFYIRRAFRILPASLVFLLAIALLSLSGVIQVSFGRWLSTLLFFANYSTAEGSWYLGHFWSLAVEEHFYFIWPLAFLTLTNNSRRVIFAVAGVLLLALWRAVDFKFQLTGSTPAVFWGRTDIQADSILCGVLVALLYSDPVWKLRLRRLLSIPAVWPVLVLLAFGMATLIALHVLGWKMAFALLTVKAIVIPLIILGTLISSTNFPGRVLESTVFRWVGRISYSLYLWQQLFLVWNEVRVPYLSPLQSLPVNIILAFACASLSLYLIEKPLISVGHRLAKRLAPLPSQISTR